MKSRIAYSWFSAIMTVLVYAVLCISCIATVKDPAKFVTLISLFFIIIVVTLFFGAIYIKATPDYIIMGSPLKSKKIFMRNIKSVELFKPTMGARRVCGSAGFMGYWGIFREGDIGRYYSFFGKASDCFLIRMRNGDKYVLGCKNPQAMTDYIKTQIIACR